MVTASASRRGERGQRERDSLCRRRHRHWPAVFRPAAARSAAPAARRSRSASYGVAVGGALAQPHREHQGGRQLPAAGDLADFLEFAGGAERGSALGEGTAERLVDSGETGCGGRAGWGLQTPMTRTSASAVSGADSLVAMETVTKPSLLHPDVSGSRPRTPGRELRHSAACGGTTPLRPLVTEGLRSAACGGRPPCTPPVTEGLRPSVACPTGGRRRRRGALRAVPGGYGPVAGVGAALARRHRCGCGYGVVAGVGAALARGLRAVAVSGRWRRPAACRRRRRSPRTGPGRTGTGGSPPGRAAARPRRRGRPGAGRRRRSAVRCRAGRSRTRSPGRGTRRRPRSRSGAGSRPPSGAAGCPWAGSRAARCRPAGGRARSPRRGRSAGSRTPSRRRTGADGELEGAVAAMTGHGDRQLAREPGEAGDERGRRVLVDLLRPSPSAPARPLRAPRSWSASANASAWSWVM